MDSLVGLFIFGDLSSFSSKLVGEQDWERLLRGLLLALSTPLWWLLELERVGDAQSEYVPLFSLAFFPKPSSSLFGLKSLSSFGVEWFSLCDGPFCPLYRNGRMPYGKNRLPNAEFEVDDDRLVFALKRWFNVSCSCNRSRPCSSCSFNEDKLSGEYFES